MSVDRHLRADLERLGTVKMEFAYADYFGPAPNTGHESLLYDTMTGDSTHFHSIDAGALVADLHRSLIEGGVYPYPADRGHPEGKLRLAYECAPLAFVVEQAGGAASTGGSTVLDVPFHSIHQRVPFVAGSRDDVAILERFSTKDRR